MLRKKTFIYIFIFSIGIAPIPAFPQETGLEQDIPHGSPAKKGRESVIAFGFESGGFFGSYFDGIQDRQTYRSASAMNLLTYTFGEGNTVGFFVHDSFGVSDRGTVDGIQPRYTNYLGLQIGMLLGPLFRYAVHEKVALLYGAGPSFVMTSEVGAQYASSLSAAEESFRKTTLTVGVGVNIMLRYAAGNGSLFLFGCILNYDFLGFAEVTSVSSNPVLNASGRLKDFSMFGARPYVSVGFRI